MISSTLCVYWTQEEVEKGWDSKRSGRVRTTREARQQTKRSAQKKRGSDSRADGSVISEDELDVWRLKTEFVEASRPQQATRV